jgi:hypothetical protein
MSARGKPAIPAETRTRAALAALLVLAAAQRAWNAWTVPPLAGYDEPGHAGYILSVILEGRLPQPFQGWATFHPPLHYLLGAALWRTLSTLGPQAVDAGLRAIGSLAGLAAGWVTFGVVRRLGGSAASALLAAASSSSSCAVMAASMIGAKALAADLPLAPRPPALQEDRAGPARPPRGLLAGLALATKYTGPARRRPLFPSQAGSDRAAPMLSPAALAVVSWPGVYARNLLTGSFLLMTRGVTRGARSILTAGSRGVLDYLSFPAGNPAASLYHVVAPPRQPQAQRRHDGRLGTHARVDPGPSRPASAPVSSRRRGRGPAARGAGTRPPPCCWLQGAPPDPGPGSLDAPSPRALAALGMYVAFTARAVFSLGQKGPTLPLAPVAGVFSPRPTACCGRPHRGGGAHLGGGASSPSSRYPSSRARSSGPEASRSGRATPRRSRARTSTTR